MVRPPCVDRASLSIHQRSTVQKVSRGCNVMCSQVLPQLNKYQEILQTILGLRTADRIQPVERINTVSMLESFVIQAYR